MATRENQGICYDIIKAYPVNDYIPFINSNVGVGEAIYGMAYLINAIVMVFWIYKQNTNAKKGIEGAALYVIFPVYVPFMWLSVLSDLLVGFVTLLTPVNYDGSNGWGLSIAIALVYALQHVVLEGIAVTMMQYGCGYQAARKAAFYASIWALFTFLVQFIVHKQGHTWEGYIADTLWNLSLMLFYLSLWLIPARNMFRRPSVIFYSKFWAFFRFLNFVSDTLILMSNNDMTTVTVGYCIFAFGLGQSHKASMSSLESNESRTSNDNQRNEQISIPISVNPKNTISVSNISEGGLRNPLLGMEVGFNEAQELAQEVDNLRSNGSVKLLNFAYISLRKRVPILGSGSFSKVYPGEYRGIPVAIKMIFTPDLNPEVIRRCCNEAEILSSIRHENVVDIYGVSVLPPSVCIVLEKCEFGSLSDILRGAEQGSMGSGVKKYPLQLTKADRMFLALGCARGLEALHCSSITLCHRDVKSFNFLVDSQLVVKIADLELADDDSEVIEGIKTEFDQRRLHQSSIMMSSWQAPEVIRGDKYLQASDVYSLALVLWEIIATSSQPFVQSSPKTYNRTNSNPNPLGRAGMPYGEFESQKEVREKIIEGVKPAMPTGFDKKHPPSAQLLSALSKMQSESNWMRLEEDGGAFLIVANEEPYYIVWATKAWSKMTGYLLNEILACDVSVIEGKSSDRGLLTEAIFSAALGVPRHVVVSNKYLSSI
eukprot:gene17731-23323_t